MFIVAGLSLAAAAPFILDYKSAFLPSLRWLFTLKAVGHLIVSALLVFAGVTEVWDSRSSGH